MLKTTISWVLLIIILAFVFAIGFEIFSKIFVAVESEYIKGSVGAFMGAFFAFIFIRIDDGLRMYYNRKEKNHSALVKYQHYLNNLLTEQNDNVYIIDSFVNIFRPNNPNISVWGNRLKIMTIENNLIHDLLNIDLMNEIFGLNTNLIKANGSIESLNRSYDEIYSSFMAIN